MINDSYIHIDEQGMIPYQIRLELDRDSLAAINLCKKNHQPLPLTGDRLTKIRYYALLVFCLGNDSELIFLTNYLQNQVSTTVIKSAIAPSGKIFQEVRADSLGDRQLFNYLLETHHWLISQIVTQLPLKSYRFTQWLPEIIAILITFIITPAVIYWLPLSFLGQFLIILIFLIILYLLLKYILINYLKQIIIYQMLFGWLRLSLAKRKIGFKLLSILTIQN